MAKVGERRIALTGAGVIVLAGFAAAAGNALPVYLASMFAIGAGWNLAYSGGSALIAASYRTSERGRVQPVAEALIIGAQVAGSLSASAFITAAGWRMLGWGCVVLGAVVAASLVFAQFRKRTVETTTQAS